MVKVSLKSIIGKNKEAHPIVLSLLQQMGNGLRVEDEKGNLMLGEEVAGNGPAYAITLGEETIGFVRGSASGETVANLLGQMAQQEADKKKLGHEVLGLYHEINVIYNFSEKLSKTIEPDRIARITLDQAVQSIPFDAGVMVLWEEGENRLKIPAHEGELLFDQEGLVADATFLLSLGLSKQSEILEDLEPLKQRNMIASEVQSLMYASLRMKHRIMGAIILTRRSEEQFTAAQLKLLVTLSLQSAAAIESALLYEKNIKEAREREDAILKIHEVTKKFVPYEFIHSLGKETLADVRLGDQAEKIVTVLFTDIRDFTTLSEKMTPEENFRFVSTFNSRLGPIIRRFNGFINQYLGDSIMAIFPGGPADALAAAVDMQRALNEFNAERRKQGLASIDAGIGMHTGPLIMGITGDEFRLDAATISDTVNTASRIESLTKQFKSALLLSEETFRHLPDPDAYHFRRLGPVKVKGKYKHLSILDCIDGYEEPVFQKKLSSLPHFLQALDHFQHKEFNQAIAGFIKSMSIDPDDLTIQFFLRNAMKYRDEGAPENWIGAAEMGSVK